jgi:hypothetical protein
MRYAKGPVQRAVDFAKQRVTRGKPCVTNSFAAGTLVALGQVASAAPIDAVQVGDRVATVAGASSTAVDASWRIVDVALDIGRTATLLRSPAWFEAHGLDPDASEVGPERRFLTFELGGDDVFTGTVEGIRSFQGPAQGPGRVVLSTLAGSAAEIYRIDFDGPASPLEVTGDHPLYSLDRAGWVDVQDLTAGEHLQVAGPTEDQTHGPLVCAEHALRIHALERVRDPQPVYNLQVEGDHEFLVGELGLRAHNCAKRPAKPLPVLDTTGKVHGELPRPKELGQYRPEDLRQLKEELRQSVQKRIQKNVEKGSDLGHGQRQAAEQQLIKSIEKFLEDH